jgi:hypothetical protein
VVVLLPEGGDGNVTDEDIMATDQPNPVDVCGELELHGSDFAQEVTDETRPKKKRRQNSPDVVWGETEIYEDDLPDAAPTSIHVKHPELVCLEPFQLFRYFYSDKILKPFFNETMRYARQHNDLNFTCQESDIMTFFRIIFLSG